ncbi:MAG: putative 4-hydroxybenzoate polyprenyltransferase [Candidatus Scalindua sp.]|nr:putative 4-hydroxybenzoate polyprenyltransferase [Candidatus Scalindua sp.]
MKENYITPDNDGTIENHKAGILRRLSSILTLIKFSHTIFSLPFAVMSAFLAANGLPTLRQFLLIIFALIMARSCAMTFNRLVDAKYDIHNPRTAYRIHLQKFVGKTTLWIFTIICTLLFVACAAGLNKLSLLVSPIALIIIFGYSYTKRFTNLSHFVLGLGLAFSPIGAWVGIRGRFEVAPFVLALGVLLWTAGFDIIYACQDVQHDIKTNLHSVPQRLGIKSSLKLARLLHTLMLLVLFSFVFFTELGIIYTVAVCFVGIMIFYEHSLIKPHDLSKINLAFFTVNGSISIFLMVITIIDIYIFNSGSH